MKVENLKFDRGDETLTPSEFAEIIKPFMADLKRHKRTNYLFVATFGSGERPAVTGYRTDTTINATINKVVTKAERTGGKWAIYQYSE